MALLLVSLDLFGAVREMRRLKEPDPAQAAVLAEIAGADGFSVQLRRERKTIRERDLYILREVIKTKLTIEMPPLDETIERAIEVKPWMVTLVADHPDIGSTVSPIDFRNTQVDFSEISSRLKGGGTNVCYFIDPSTDAVKGAFRAGASAVMLDCSGFSDARTFEDAQQELDRIDSAAQEAAKAGLGIHASRGLTYKNVRPLVEIKLIDEFVIGHAIITRAMLVGIERAVTEMLQLVRHEPA